MDVDEKPILYKLSCKTQGWLLSERFGVVKYWYLCNIYAERFQQAGVWTYLGHNFSHGITGCEIWLRESGLRLTC